MDAAERLRVFAAHQETMRRFLESQQSILLQALALGRGEVPESDSAPDGAPIQDTPLAGSVEAASPAVESQPVPEPVIAFYSRAILAPVETSSGPGSLSGLHLVTDGGAALTEAVRDGLAAAGAVVGVVADDLLSDREGLAAKMQSLTEQFGPVKALIHLGGLVGGTLPLELAGWKELTTRQCKNFFALLQVCAGDLRATAGHVLAFSSLGGSFGRMTGNWLGLPSAGAFTGLLKTAGIEWPEVHLRAIDLPEMIPNQLAGVVADELRATDHQGEIGYLPTGRHYYEVTPEAPEPSAHQVASLKPGPDWVIFATGGAQGITAVSLEEILGPGMTLVTVGRSPEPGPEPELTAGITEVTALRKLLLEDFRNRGEKVTPALIEKRIGALMRERAVRDNLAKFRALGATVDYRSVDVGNGEAFAAVLDAVYAQYGRIDVVLHGAGIIEDRLIVDKSAESFARVFDTKVDSTFVLARKLRPESLRWLIFYASVAGRTGNRGQCDYAAANEVINRLAWWLHHQWPGVRISCLNWGPWASGMASDEVNKAFLARGVVPIPPMAGRAFLREEMERTDITQVEKIAGIYRAPSGS